MKYTEYDSIAQHVCYLLNLADDMMQAGQTETAEDIKQAALQMEVMQEVINQFAA